MYSIVLADDELLIRNQLAHSIDSMRGDFYICAEASNGKEALDSVEKLHPDILITDMKMPVMDGLELLKRIKNNVLNQPAVIAISNYDDYEYVRSAMKLGASDYLLKHMINDETLRAILESCVHRLRQNRVDHHENVEMDVLGQNEMRRSFCMGLITGSLLDPYLIERDAKRINFQVNGALLLPVLMDVVRVSEQEKTSLQWQNLFLFSIVNIANEILAEDKNAIAFHVAENRFCVLFSFVKERSTAAIDAVIQNNMSLIEANITKLQNANVRYISGRICRGIQELPMAYTDAERVLDNQIYKTGRRTAVAQRQMESTRGNGLEYDVLRKLSSAFKSADWELIKKLLTGIFAEIRKKNICFTEYKAIVYDLLNIIVMAYKAKGLNMYQEVSKPISFEDVHRNRYELEEIEKRILNICRVYVDKISRDEHDDISRYVKEVLLIVRRDYAKHISLADIADEIGINYSYLSKLFKQEMRMGFPEYLNHYRIEKAKTMLMMDALTIREIAERCGFLTYEHFFKVFKQKEGITPKEFIERVQEPL